MSARWTTPLLVALLAAGCTGAPADEPELRMLALDGRWPFDPARAAAMLADAGAPAPLGALVAGEALGARVLDFVALDAGAAARLGVTLPARGELVATVASGLALGDDVTLRAHAWPTPYVATFFEMERVPPCALQPEAKLCALEPEREGEARLRLRVDEGARDLGLLPDLVEIGANGLPAYWNGTFRAPDGAEFPLAALASAEGALVPAELPAVVAAGEWNVLFRLEANGTLAAPAAAGVVRVREPGYQWFDDRLVPIDDAEEQARAVLANATATSARARVTGITDALPLGADILLSLDDARALVGAPSGVSALLVESTRAHERALDAKRGSDGLTTGLRMRALPTPAAAARTTGALVFAAPADLDLAALPPVEGALAPSLALAGRPPVGESVRVDGARIDGPLLFLAHAAGPAPWTLPPGARWSAATHAIENLSRSRTLALASDDVTPGPLTTLRLELGAGNTSRTLVDIGGVAGGPTSAFWTSPAFVAGAGQPVAPRVLLPLAPGADRDAVLARAVEAYAAHGVVPER